MKNIDGFDGFERALSEEKREEERSANKGCLIATAAVATVLILGISRCVSNKVTAPVAETKAVEETPKTYLAASGTSLNKYLDQNFTEQPARFITVRDEDGRLEEVRIGSDSGTHWNIYSCKADGTYSWLYDVREGGKKSGAAHVYSDKFCHFAFEKEGSVEAIAVTDKRAEISAQEGFKACPSNVGCYRYTVNTKWAPTTSTEPVPDGRQMEEIGNTRDRLRDEQRREDFDRKWAEGEVEDLKKACRMGQKHWTLCPDGYDKR
jgi:hypothetical protein